MAPGGIKKGRERQGYPLSPGGPSGSLSGLVTGLWCGFGWGLPECVPMFSVDVPPLRMSPGAEAEDGSDGRSGLVLSASFPMGTTCFALGSAACCSCLVPVPCLSQVLGSGAGAWIWYGSLVLVPGSGAVVRIVVPAVVPAPVRVLRRKWLRGTPASFPGSVLLSGTGHPTLGEEVRPAAWLRSFLLALCQDDRLD